ncbi:MAG: hypothetical protein D6732_04570 [Methanobacteriota archaeon]|nr:MAG: hypothetical protein D6732_04570 [Euryarchaeota archaeon]
MEAIEGENFCIKPICVKSQYISDEEFESLYEGIIDAGSDVFVFLHEPNFESCPEKKSKLRSLSDILKNIYIMEFGGGVGSIYKHFVDVKTKGLKGDINGKNIKCKLNACIQEYYLLPKFVKLYKRLIIEKLFGNSIDSALLGRLLTENDELKNVDVPEDKRSNEKDILDYITNRIV